MKRLLTLVAFFATLQASAQQVNPVPDYVFANRMSAGRNTVTDTAAYFSIGPRYGANKGFMPPIVGDTATFSSGKRNGLLIFSVQKNKFLYWDSVRVQWSDMAGSSGSYIVAGDTASMLTPYVRQAGYGLTKSSQSFLVDTLNIATRAWRQKGVDSVAGLSRIGGSGTAFYIPRFSTSSTLQNSIIYDDGAKVGVGTSSPIGTFQVYKSGAPAYITLTGGSGANQGAAFVIYKSNNSLSLINIGDKAALVGGAPDTAVTFRAGANVPLIFEPNASEALRLNNNQTITATSLAGSGSRIVVADANGTLSASSALSGYVDGSGTTNYVAKFTAGSTIGNSQIFDNGTNVGIGTASPLVKLDIVSSAGTVVRTKGGTGSAQGSAYYVQLAGSTNTLSAFGDRANIFGGTVDQIASIYTGSSIPLTFDVNTAERMRIFANGRVGINTTTDAGYQLDVNGTLRSVNGANFATTSGNVGIGTATPQRKVVSEIIGANDFNFAATSASLGTIGNWVGYLYGFAGNTYQKGATFFESIDGNARGKFHIAMNDAATSANVTLADARLTVTSAGNVGIGTASPAAKLDIAYSTNPTTATPHILLTTGGTSKQAAITAESFSVSGLVFSVGDGTLVDRMTILRSNGNVGIGTTSPSEKLHVAGNIYNTGSAVLAATSGNVGVGTTTINAKLHVLSATGTAQSLGDWANNIAIIQGASRTGTTAVGGSFATTLSLQSNDDVITAGSGASVGFSAKWNSALYGSAAQFASIFGGKENGSDASLAGYLSFATRPAGGNPTERGRINSAGEWIIDASGTDAGDYKLQVSGNIYNTGSITTGAPSGGSIKPWKIGEAATVSPTSPNRTIRVEIDGVVYYLHAKTTND